jgi:hypothetical protein
MRSAANLLVVLCIFATGDAMAEGKIIFADSFDAFSLAAWDEDSVVDDEHRLRLSAEAAYRGEYGVEVIARPGSGAGAKLNKWFMPGYDQVYARWYCRFDENFDQGNHMHFAHLLANRADNKWSAFGQAGRRPSGADFFTTGLEPWRDWGNNPAPGEMMLYAYHMDMPIDPKMNQYWGEMMRPEQPFVLERGRWYCMEMMLKANTPGEKDGEQAFWIDGREVAHFGGLRWREDANLKINDFWLMLYVHQSERINRVFFDEVVISTDYIGPLAGETASRDSTWGRLKKNGEHEP